ncbi:MAG TPA: hypothetical protein VIS71_05940 [Terrimicrobium sp.]
MNSFRTILVSGPPTPKPASRSISSPPPLHLSSEVSERTRIFRLEAETAQVTSIHRKTTSVLSTPLATRSFQQNPVQQNDLVAFANRAGMWTVVAPVNGSKADLRRSEGFDIRIVTAPLESITVVQHAGSPGYGY